MFTVAELIAASLVAFGAAALQGSVGFGFAIISVPVLSLVDPRFAPIPVLIVTMGLASLSLVRERRLLDFDGIGWIIAGRIPGAVAGAWILTIVSRRTLSIVIAVVVVAAVTILASGTSIALNRRNRVLAGIVSGFTGASAGIGGPPLALLYRSAAGGTVRSSLGAIFTVGIAINLVILGVAGAMTLGDWQAAGSIAPAALVGFGFSSAVRHRFDGRLLRRSILAVAGLAGALLLFTSLAG